LKYNSVHILLHLELLIGLLVILIIASCSTTKYVPDGNYLLSQSQISFDNKKIKKEELKPLIKQKPNKSILWIYKFHLHLYDLSKPEKNNGWNNYLRKIGEEPVIYDSLQTKTTLELFKGYMENKGYYHSKISDSVRFKGKKAYIKYYIESGTPFHIRSLDYNFEDSLLTDIVLKDTANSLLKDGSIFDIDLLQKERSRVETSLRSQGYYNFSKDYIYFNADTTVAPNQVDITLGIKMFLHKNPDNSFDTIPHRKYMVNKVGIYPDYDPRKALTAGDSLSRKDTLNRSDVQIIYEKRLGFKPQALVRPNYVTKGDLYNVHNVEQTYKHYSSLRTFKMVNIQFDEVEDSVDSTGNYLLNGQILLTPDLFQNFKIEPEANITHGYWGTAINLSYQHKNLFKGAEILDIGFRGAFRWLKLNGYPVNETEFGPHLNLRIPSLLLPQFLLPFNKESFVKRYDPVTNFTVSYDKQKNPKYWQEMGNVTMGYVWKGSGVETNYVNPIDFNYVNYPWILPSFLDTITKYHYNNTYSNHLVPAITYSYVFDNHEKRKNRDYTYFRMNLQSAGLILTRLNTWFNGPRDSSGFTIFNKNYSQFVRGDFDFHYNQYIDGTNSMAYRAFLGIGLPYGNSTAIPFEWRYFSGGSNGIRAWIPLTLGPGTYPEYAKLGYRNSTGDIKIEANMEYRFKVFWILEGALFVDMGNIWDIKYDATRPGASFEWNKFYKDFAIGSGLGFRFNFPFVLARLDIGAKVRDPSLTTDRWIVAKLPYNFYDNCYINIGIGYPF
jgi:hypothetical protein